MQIDRHTDLMQKNSIPIDLKRRNIQRQADRNPPRNNRDR